MGVRDFSQKEPSGVKGQVPQGGELPSLSEGLCKKRQRGNGAGGGGPLGFEDRPLEVCLSPKPTFKAKINQGDNSVAGRALFGTGLGSEGCDLKSQVSLSPESQTVNGSAHPRLLGQRCDPEPLNREHGHHLGGSTGCSWGGGLSHLPCDAHAVLWEVVGEGWWWVLVVLALSPELGVRRRVPWCVLLQPPAPWFRHLWTALYS